MYIPLNNLCGNVFLHAEFSFFIFGVWSSSCICGEQGLLSSCSVRASHCRVHILGTSASGALACWLSSVRASVVAAQGLISCGSQFLKCTHFSSGLMAVEHRLGSCGTPA